MIPQDADTLAAWAEYERRNARANGEYLYRLSTVRDSDQAFTRRLRLVEAS